MKRKNVFRFFFLPLLVIIVAGWYVLKEYNRTHADTSSLRPDFSVVAKDLVKEFTVNEQASNKKYWDKVVEVNGMVKEISHDENGIYNLALGDTSELSSVRCSIDSLHSKEATSIEKGAIVTMKGVCTGFNADELLGSDVILVRCVLSSKK